MLPQVVLDDERFAQIAERAKEQICQIMPEWTDHNAHDPGITVLELFAWMKEMQQFHMDRITRAHRLSFLRLMGVVPEKIRAARAVIFTDAAKHPVFFPKGSRFYAGDVCFEAAAEIRAGAEEITGLSVCAGQENDPAYGVREQEQAVQPGESSLCLPAFGEMPEAGSALKIALSGALAPYVMHSIYIRLSHREPFQRNPIGDGEDFYPLAELSLQYRGKRGMCRAEIMEDTTRGLLEDGWLRFRLNREMQEEDGVFYLYLTLVRGEYEAVPVIAGISLHGQPAAQQRTIAEYHEGTVCGGEQMRISTYLAMTGEFLMFRREEHFFVPYDGRVEKRISDEAAFFFLPELPEGVRFSYRIVFSEAGRKEGLRIGNGRGLPNQEYVPGIPGLCADGMCLMMEQEKGSGRYVSAQLCEDFMQAGAYDAVFQYEEESGILRFGDCDHGAAPEGEILFASARSSLGAGGNVKAGSIRRLEDGQRQIFVNNERAAAGGKNAETLSECGERLKKLRERSIRAVTDEDFERLVMRTPGLMIESVKVLAPVQKKRKRTGGGDQERQENCVTIVVKPYSTQPEAHLSEAYRKNILRMLETRRPVGTRIRLLSPEYIGISLFGEIEVNGQEETAKISIEKELKTFFAAIGTRFGEPVRMSAVYGIVDVLPVTARIVSLTLHVRGKDIRKNRSGDLILPASGLAYLRECELNITPGR